MRCNHGLERWAGLLLLVLAPVFLAAGCADPDRPVTNGSDAPVAGQAAFEGVEGRVTAAGQPLAGVSVQPRSLDNPATAIPEMAVVSTDDGQYRWRLRPGEYEITFVLDGYQPATRQVTVQPRQAARLDVELEPVR